MNPYDLIDDYVQGALNPADTLRFEQTLAGDAGLRAEVAAAREMASLVGGLSREEQPSTDLWPGIAEQLDEQPAQSTGRGLWWGLGAAGLGAGALAAAALVAVGIGGAMWFGGDLLGGLGMSQENVAANEAAEALRAGDLPQADSRIGEAADDRHDAVQVHITMAYTSFLKGDYKQADTLLEKAVDEADDDEVIAELTLRRAVVAHKRGDLHQVQELGLASGLPQGLLFAAEVHLADAEADDAFPLLTRAAKSSDPVVRSTARTYLTYLDDDENGRAQLAEATALWALGQHPEAVETAADLLSYMPVDFVDRDELLLVWAGRAVTSQRPDEAETMLDEMGSPPAGQAWRVQATRGLMHVVRGNNDDAQAIFMALAEAGAPEDGLADAIATAVAITKDEAFAHELANGLEHPAIALRMKDPTYASAGPLRDYLEGQ